MIERQIIIALIVSTDYLRQIRDIFNVQFLESEMARRLAGWCIEFYDQYHEAPQKHIQDIYYEKLSQGLLPEIATEIEEDILPGLSEEYEQESINVRYLLRQTRQHFTRQHLEMHKEQIEELLNAGKLNEAERISSAFKPLKTFSSNTVDLSKESSLSSVTSAFSEVKTPVIYYARQLGQFWNDELIKGGFVVLMGSEKRGKTWRLLEMSLRAARQKRKVAFFQAGDMTDNQQIRRIGINLAGKSDKEKFLGKQLEPVRDCILNQLDLCTKKERECDFGVFDDKSEEFIRNEARIGDIRKAIEEFPTYKPCYNCTEYWNKKLGAVWMKEIDMGDEVLTAAEAVKHFEKFFIRYKRNFRIETYTNGSLTLGIMNETLDRWKREDNWEPDLIALDYVDLLAYDGPRTEFRHQINSIWKGCRAISQDRNQPLFLTATQADAKSFEKKRLRLSNFSEDKRKYGHATAMYGLNQDPNGREKGLGLMIINKLVLREDDFEIADEVTVLQNLRRGRPFLGSYF